MSTSLIAAPIQTIFAQPDAPSARTQLRVVVDQLKPVAPDVATKLDAAEGDLLAYTSLPQQHWSKIWSNKPIERLNRELKGRTDVVQIFPDTESVIRLIGALLVEVNDEMISSERRYIAATSPPDPSPPSPTERTANSRHSQQHPEPDNTEKRTPELHHPTGLNHPPDQIRNGPLVNIQLRSPIS